MLLINRQRLVLGFACFMVLFVSSSFAVKVSDAVAARDKFLDRQSRQRQDTGSFDHDKHVVLSNNSLVFNSSCILMEVDGILLWARPPGSVSLAIDEELHPRTVTVEDSQCDNSETNGTASMTVRMSDFKNSTLLTSVTFSMVFTHDVFWWFLQNFTMTVDGKNQSGPLVLDTLELYGSMHASYYCKEPSITNFKSPLFAGDQATEQYGLQFREVIFQPFLNNTGDTFDPNEPCEYAFTIGLWMAVITGLVMILILFFGVTMLTSVRTMDRFDDPKTSKLLSVPNE